MPRFVLLKKHHAVFAERDENIFCFPLLKKRFAGAHEIDVVWRNSIRIASGNTSGKQSFHAVRLNYCNTTPIHQVAGIGISRDDLAGRARVIGDLRNHLRRQKTFAIIFENDRVDLWNILLDRCHDLLKLLWRWPGKLFAIDTDNLLMTRDDPRLQNRAKRLVFNRIRDIDFLSGQ